MPLFRRTPNEEQMTRRQSTPQPTIEQTAAAIDAVNASNGNGAMDGFKALAAPIGRKQVQHASQILSRYKEGKANLENQIVENDRWYRLRHWDVLKGDKNQVQPTSAWLFNALANKHADAMDNYPSPNILPREELDKGEAKALSSILPVILDQCDFEKVYSDEWDYKLKSGTGVYGIFWDNSKLNGLGDISIQQIDILNLFWEPGVKDIQRSRNMFCVELMDNDLLEQRYPQTRGQLATSTVNVAKYIYDDTIDTSNKSAVVDWYYKKANAEGRTVLHYCKYVNDVVLFATENDPNYADRGWYDSGKFPFVFDTMFRMEGSPCGFGYIDVAKSAQEYIDRGNQAILENMLANARPRYFIKSDGSVNEAEYADQTKDFVHVDGVLGQDSVMPVEGKQLNSIYVDVINQKVDELKEVTGNRDISTGGTTSGVTAASAIAAMQEAGSKLSRDHIKASYRVFREICLQIIELIRQFYDVPRYFRILGQNGAEEFIQYSNAQIMAQPQGTEFDVNMGFRMPVFDVEVTAQKRSPYSKMSQNELALQFYSAGFFNPQMSDQALACLEMMDFDRKDFIMQRIAENGTMYQRLIMAQQQMLALAQLVDQSRGSNIADQIAAEITGGAPVTPIDGTGPAETNAPAKQALGDGDANEEEPENVKKSKQRVADSTSPT